MALVSILIEIPLEVAVFAESSKSDVLDAVTYRNFFRMLCRGALYFVLLFSTYVFKTSFYILIACMCLMALVSFIAALKMKRKKPKIA